VAWFGYDNSSSEVVIIPTPSLNHFSPPPKDRGQTTTFEPGRHEFVFSVPFSGSLTWVLETQPALAKPDSTPCPGPPTITTSSLPDGTAGVPYTALVEATGGAGTRTFTATGLPAGLNIAPDGTISGTPTAAGTFSVQVTVTDAIGQKASKSLSLKVEGVLLQCEEGANTTSAGGEGTPDGVLTLDTSECEPITVVFRTNFEEDVQEVELVKHPSGNTFTLDITWEPEDREYPLPPTEIDYDGEGPGVAQPVEWCLSGPELPPDQNWCLVEHEAKVVSGDQVQVAESYFGKNDPTWTRR
jgi:hypothetical protein